jgi:hypothetical protein
MKNNFIKKLLFIPLTGFILLGCSRNETKYYEDGEDKGIAIFSNTSNNVSSCFVAGRPWRTASRTTSGLSSFTNYEVEIIRQQASAAKDTLIILWRGYFEPDKFFQAHLSMHLALPANFTYRDLPALQGKRLSIDSSNGFFELDNSFYNPTNRRGRGNIYFQTAQFDSVLLSGSAGRISGLFEADFSSFKITRGRFDHFISPQQIRF